MKENNNINQIDLTTVALENYTQNSITPDQGMPCAAATFEDDSQEFIDPTTD